MTDIQELATKLLKKAESLRVDYADVRASTIRSTSFALHNGKFESPLVSGDSFGIGVRIIHKGKLGFYSTNDAAKASKAVELALKLAKTNPSKQRIKLYPTKPIQKEYTIKAKKPVKGIPIETKIKLARDLTASAQLEKHKNKIKAIDVGYGDGHGEVIFFSSEGARLVRHGGRTIIKAGITAKAGAQLEQARGRYGGNGFESYNNCLQAVKAKAKLAVDLLKARLPKAGMFNAVLDNEAAGVFAHEAVGHACEADAILNGDSVLKGKLNKSIGAGAVNISDSPTIEGEFGSYKYDSEGTPAQYNKLIVGGVLKKYLHSRTTAAEMNQKPTGNARAQSYAHIPIVRMSNTFFEGGDYSVSELIKEVKNGYLLEGFRGGTVSPLAGDFTFACEDVREIKNGQLGVLLKGCTFGGTILGTLHDIFGCGPFDPHMDIGWCGKGGQSVPAGTGACHIGIKGLHIGGSE